MVRTSATVREMGGDVIECRKCTAGLCSHEAQCPMMIRWYDDAWDGTFWRRCQCAASIERESPYPVTIGYVSNRRS